VHLRGAIFQPSNHQLQCCLESVGIDELLPLLLRLGDTASQTEDPGLKLLLVKEAVRLTVNEPRESLAQLAEVGLQRRARGVIYRRFWLQPTPVFLREALGVRKQR